VNAGYNYSFLENKKQEGYLMGFDLLIDGEI